MSDPYPKEVSPSAPPSYEQAIYLSQSPPVGTSMLVTTQSLIYGNVSVRCICRYCNGAIDTRIERKTGLAAWLICGGIVLMGGWCGCCLIPFCIDSLKDVEHYCPRCSRILGARRQL